jgi:molybdenum cofactor synthesis domain-containing protein
MSELKRVTAAMVAIGDELLSGRTKDKNISHLANLLTVKGIDLAEVRIVADDMDAIADAVNALRARYDYVFTSGGIGPTHDDITTQAIAKAFGVSAGFHPKAFEMLRAHYEKRGMEFTPARQKMATTPQNAALIDNLVSVAPGFQMANVYVMAGVPAVFNAMIAAIEPELKGGEILLAASIDCPHGEGDIGDQLAQIALNHRDVSIGSYPRFTANTYSTQIVMRSRSQQALDAAFRDIGAMLENYTNA